MRHFALNGSLIETGLFQPCQHPDRFAVTDASAVIP